MRQRAFSQAPEIRDERRLIFYPAIFNVPAVVTEHGETVIEILRPGMFKRSLSATGEIIATVEHDPGRTFARRSTGLLLQEDQRGLFASVYLEANPLNDSILSDVRAGTITGASFTMRDTPNGRRTLDTPGKFPTVEVLDCELLEVTLAAGTQVYRQTTVSVRTAAIENALLRLRLVKSRRT